MTRDEVDALNAQDPTTPLTDDDIARLIAHYRTDEYMRQTGGAWKPRAAMLELQRHRSAAAVAPRPDVTVHALAMQEWRQRALATLRAFSQASGEAERLREEVARLTTELDEVVPVHVYLGISEEDERELRALATGDARDWLSGVPVLRGMFRALDGE